MGILDFFNRTPTPAKFARIVMQAARERGVDGPMEFDAQNFRIVLGKNDVVNLHNFYHDYCQAPRAGRDEVVAKYSHLFVRSDIPDAFDAARRNVLPVLRTRAFLQAARFAPLLDAGVKETRFAMADFSDDTALLLAYDTEHLTRVLGMEQLATWGVSLEEATAVALDNLRDLAAEKFIQISPTQFASDWNDAYDSSRLLLADLAHRVAGPRAVAMIPTRGRMLLSAARGKADLLALLQNAKAAIDQEGRRVSTLMYEFVDGRPVPFRPEDEEVACLLADLQRIALQEDYAEQKQLLEQVHEKQGVDVFVATYMLYKGEDQGVFSVATWTEDVDALLPRADKLAFVEMNDAGETRSAGVLEWERVEAAAGHLMQLDPELYPPRYRVKQFPDLASLGLQ
ncbi:hypothetical protein [Massilia sp. Mn16-1_5]|uniref:hypothetical protein n=1 Tax=Massilia sp. Mn16-1_5 TaxID=2079199 RepID=UPI00109ED420|nr:hypothetical protein [Massilia sp. Mn16-1_5]THC46101.1 hypothetical protein C2862_02405 [Massilia sp. Mn16-1_5]